MSLVKEYKGVNIYVTLDGEFYCDGINNSNDYRKKTFVSKKMQSIEKAIDDLKGEDIDGNEYYEITPYNNRLKLLKVIKKIGSRVFFDDGTDSSNPLRRELYPKIISQNHEFGKIECLIMLLQENEKEIKRLYDIQVEQRIILEKKLRNFTKQKPF